MIVDEQQALGALDRGHRRPDLGAPGGGIVGFVAQLQGGHPGAGQAAHPVGTGQHGIEAQGPRAGREGRRAGTGAQAEIRRLDRPGFEVEATGALALALPGAGQAGGVGGDKAQPACGGIGDAMGAVIAWQGLGIGLGGQTEGRVPLDQGEGQV